MPTLSTTERRRGPQTQRMIGVPARSPGAVAAPPLVQSATPKNASASAIRAAQVQWASFQRLISFSARLHAASIARAHEATHGLPYASVAARQACRVPAKARPLPRRRPVRDRPTSCPSSPPRSPGHQAPCSTPPAPAANHCWLPGRSYCHDDKVTDALRPTESANCGSRAGDGGPSSVASLTRGAYICGAYI